jgi:hypothetical protein
MNGGEEVDFPSVIASGDAAKVFQFVEEPLDPIAQPVVVGVVRDQNFTVCAWIG